MNEVTLVKGAGNYADEDKNFWEKHLKVFESSRLTKAGYCRREGIHYDRFRYWEKRLSASKANVVCEKKTLLENGLALLEVKIRENCDEKRLGVLGLCSLDLGNGRVLQIHDPRVVELILRVS